jgi:hypothetical protein
MAAMPMRDVLERGTGAHQIGGDELECDWQSRFGAPPRVGSLFPN